KRRDRQARDARCRTFAASSKRKPPHRTDATRVARTLNLTSAVPHFIFMETTNSGKALLFSGASSHTNSDRVRIPERIEIGAEPGLQFELAGPRDKLFFDAGKTRAGIVTCGGLVPGLQNAVLFLPHWAIGAVCLTEQQ